MDSNFKFDLADEVKDVITGFAGIIRARTEYLTGCNSYGIQKQTLTKDGKLEDWVWIDEKLLKLKTKNKIKFDAEIKEEIEEKNGGPLSNDQYAPQ